LLPSIGKASRRALGEDMQEALTYPPGASFIHRRQEWPGRII
jgi:hypothetical protein